MKSIVKIFILLLVTGSVAAQSQKDLPTEFPIEQIVSVYARTSGDKVIIDPRVKGRVRVLGQSMETMSYDNLLTILNVHNMGVFRSDGYVIVIPQNIMKQQAVELVKEGKQFALNQVVTDLIVLDKLCPRNLVPLLRPLMPPTSHFSLLTSPRSLLITDTYGNTKRIRGIIERLDSQLEKKQACDKPTKKAD